MAGKRVDFHIIVGIVAFFFASEPLSEHAKKSESGEAGGVTPWFGQVFGESHQGLCSRAELRHAGVQAELGNERFVRGCRAPRHWYLVHTQPERQAPSPCEATRY